MSDDLTNSRRKIARAKQKLDALRHEVTAYMDSRPYRLVEEADANSYFLRSYIDREPDPEWALDLGEIAGQARSALDLLVRQLVINSGNPLRGRTQFPIFRDSNDYFGKRGKAPSFRDTMLQGVASHHRTVIDNFQPYQVGRGVEDHPLAILESITNRDKHRDVHVVLAAIAGSKVTLLFSDGRRYDVAINQDSPHRIVNGEIALGIKNDPPPSAPDQQVKMLVKEITIDLFFEGDGLFVTVETLDRVVLYVSHIISRFEERIAP